jgi:type I restriction enzyme M protein
LTGRLRNHDSALTDFSKKGYVPSVKHVPYGKLLCYITYKVRRNTPEENVRQRIAKSLVQEYGYRRTDIDVEFRIKLGSSKPRIDLPVFFEGTPHTQENVYIAIETKKESIKLNDKKEGIDQLKSYMAACVNAQFGLWTNGLEIQCFQKVEEKGKYVFNDIIDIPSRGKTIDEFEKPTFARLRPAVDLRSVFKRCHNYIYGNQGLPKDKAFHELLKLIFSKVRDERESKEVQFYTTNKEIHSTMGQLKVQNRIGDLFEQVKAQYPHIFKDPNEKIELNPLVLTYVVNQIQPYLFLETDADVKGAAYEEIVGANLRGDRGEFFTPRNVCSMAIDMLFSTVPVNSWKEFKILDPACGTGGFLIATLNYVKNKFFEEEYSKWKDEDIAKQRVMERLKGYCEHSLYGIDINPLLVRAAQMNEVMHGNGSGNLFSVNSLLKPVEWSPEVRAKIDLEMFDFVFTNPPFGTKIPIDSPEILGQYELGHIWRKGKMTEDLHRSVAPERLFIERCVQFVKPTGRIAIVLPDSILSNPNCTYIRHWILKQTKVLASIDLPTETFLPFSS